MGGFSSIRMLWSELLTSLSFPCSFFAYFLVRFPLSLSFSPASFMEFKGEPEDANMK
jgi:hypothetical protein